MTGTIESRRPLRGRAPLLAALAGAGVVVAPDVAEADMPDWATQTWYQARGVPVASFVPGAVPSIIPAMEVHPDETGLIGSFQPLGATVSSGPNANAFFQPLGTNGRTCFSCHQPQDGWALKPETVLAMFRASEGRDPVFAAVDGADCPDLVADEAEEDQCRPEREHEERAARFMAARRQLFKNGNFRVFLPVSPSGVTPEWTVRVLHDPYGCEKSETYGLPSGLVSVYRRPLPATNTFSLDPGGRVDPNNVPLFNIMWDAREHDLSSQFTDATLIHAQAGGPPDDRAIGQGVSFQNGIFTAQVHDRRAGDLDAAGAKGGTAFLAGLPAGIGPVPLPGQPPPEQFNLFDAWSALTGRSHTTAARASIARGEAIFDGKARTFTVADVAGLNDVLNANPRPGTFCGTCHNNQDRGNDFFLDPKRLGIRDNSCAPPNKCDDTRAGARVALPLTRDLPIFELICPRDSSGQSTIPFFTNPVHADGSACAGRHCRYDAFVTNDPGAGLVTGKCADVGRMKVPILRGLAARAPFFHDGSAATLDDVVDFYDQRFDIGFTADEKHDLVAFLEAL